MNIFRSLIQKTPWYGQAFLIALLLVAGVEVVSQLTLNIEEYLLISLTLLGLGAVSILGGYLFSTHSGYEIAPQPRQILGSLFAGAAVSVMFYSALQFILISPGDTVAILLAAVGILFFSEFILLRITQSHSITIWHLFSLVLIAYAVVSIINTLPKESLGHIITFISAGVVSLLIGRVGHTYLLSPWVNSFWHGFPILGAGFIVLVSTSTSDLASSLTDVFNLPIWIGIIVFVISISALTFRFLKHKLRISKGYMQYKLQLLTVLFPVVALFFGLNLSKELLISSLALVVAYSVADKSLFIKDK